MNFKIQESKTPIGANRIIGSYEFIEKNKLKLKSQNEISKKYDEILKEQEVIEFRGDVIIECLSFENAKQYLKEDYVNKVKNGVLHYTFAYSIEEVTQDFLDYMVFAWGKAENMRGISASRSIVKLGMWLWILGREDLCDLINEESLYNPYGAPALITVCKELGIEVPNSLIEFSKNK